MDTSWRPKTLGGIFGADQGDSPVAKVFRRYLELDVRTESQLRQLSRRDRYLWLVFSLQSQVENGGIDQFLWNSQGDYATETLEALQAIDAGDTHLMLKEACALFPDGRPSKDQEMRQDQIRAISKRFEGKHLDDLVAGDLVPNLSELVWEYHRLHMDAT